MISAFENSAGLPAGTVVGQAAQPSMEEGLWDVCKTANSLNSVPTLNPTIYGSEGGQQQAWLNSTRPGLECPDALILSPNHGIPLSTEEVYDESESRFRSSRGGADRECRVGPKMARCGRKRDDAHISSSRSQHATGRIEAIPYAAILRYV